MLLFFRVQVDTLLGLFKMYQYLSLSFARRICAEKKSLYSWSVLYTEYPVFKCIYLWRCSCAIHDSLFENTCRFWQKYFIYSMRKREAVLMLWGAEVTEELSFLKSQNVCAVMWTWLSSRKGFLSAAPRFHFGRFLELVWNRDVQSYIQSDSWMGDIFAS